MSCQFVSVLRIFGSPRVLTLKFRDAAEKYNLNRGALQRLEQLRGNRVKQTSARRRRNAANKRASQNKLSKTIRKVTKKSASQNKPSKTIRKKRA